MMMTSLEGHGGGYVRDRASRLSQQQAKWANEIIDTVLPQLNHALQRSTRPAASAITAHQLLAGPGLLCCFVLVQSVWWFLNTSSLCAVRFARGNDGKTQLHVASDNIFVSILSQVLQLVIYCSHFHKERLYVTTRNSITKSEGQIGNFCISFLFFCKCLANTRKIQRGASVEAALTV